jgi:hypothetical protein
MRPATHNT